MKQPSKVTMDMLKGIVSSQRQNVSEPVTNLNTEVSSQAADWVWQQMAEIYESQWIRENGEKPSRMWKIALNKQSQAEVKQAVAEVLNQAITWPPNLPKFIELCQGGAVDTDEAFNRMISGKPSNGIAEWQTRQECAHRCKRQLPEDKARLLFKKTLLRHIQRVKSGELVEPVVNEKQIVSPEVHREKETPEQRNSRLDLEIVKMLEAGTELRGPFKNRFNETKGK